MRRPAASNWTAVALLAGLTLLLLYPLHVRYQNPDQDVPVALALGDLHRGEWRPATLVYPTAMTNLLRTIFAGALRGGWYADRSALVDAWYAAPWRFRLLPRLVAIAAGVASLAAALRLGTILADRSTGLLAAALLGTSLMFVREHHHGMLDQPGAAAAAWAVALATAYVAAPSFRTLVLAGVCTGLAISFKYNLGLAGLSVIVAGIVAPDSARARTTAVAAAVAAALVALAVTSPGVVFEPSRLRATLAMFVPVQMDMLRRAAPAAGNRLFDVLRLGLGSVLLVGAGLGVARAGAVGMRAAWPLLAFVAAYGVVLAMMPLVLNRYALPLAVPLAVLAALGIDWLRPWPLRAAAVLVVLALAAPPLREFLVLLATEDTRVAAARWIEEQVPADSPVVVACTSYAAPDLAAESIAGLRDFLFVFGAGELVPGRIAKGPRIVPFRGGANAAEIRALHGDAVIVTCEHLSQELARVDSPPGFVATLEREAVLVADFPIARTGGERGDEPFDLDDDPWEAGMRLRPGPRLRLWRVPTAGG